MSVLDLDYYKLTMLQFIWKHYADAPVTFRLHSRKQDLADIVDDRQLQRDLDSYAVQTLTDDERQWLLEQGIFEPAFIDDLGELFEYDLQDLLVSDSRHPRGTVEVTGSWFNVTLWETVVLSRVTEAYSRDNVQIPDLFKSMEDVSRISNAGAKWADFGTRRRWSYDIQETLVRLMAGVRGGTGLIGTANAHIAQAFNIKAIGTYAHELEMVLRPYFKTEFDTTRDVLSKWGRMYPRDLRIALTDTYTTKKFFNDHGDYLLENDWRGVRLDSGNPSYLGYETERWLDSKGIESFDVVFSDGLDADKIIDLQTSFGVPDAYYGNGSPVNPVFGWGTGFTNPNSDLSLVMKAVESNGQHTYKITDDAEKSIR